MIEHIHTLENSKSNPAAGVSVCNESVQQNINSGLHHHLQIQPKLLIGDVNDPLEQEADNTADKIMRMTESTFIQRKCAECEEEEKLQRKSQASFIQKKDSEGVTIASQNVSDQTNARKGMGQSMDSGTRSFMESRFGTGFTHVNIHTGNEAVELNRELKANAFTVGNDIYFNSGKYMPESNDGKHLLAHELTHTIQQGKNKFPAIQRQHIIPCSPYMNEKDRQHLKPSSSANPQQSWDRLIGNARTNHKSSDKEKQNRGNESVNRFLQTNSGQWLITQIDSFFAKKKHCKNVGIYLFFVNKISGKGVGDASGFATSDYVDLYECDGTKDYKIEVKYAEPDTPGAIVPYRETSEGILHNYSDPESEMAHTLYHELMHIWFKNVMAGDQSVAYDTGHGSKVDQGEIEPEFCKKIISFVKDLDSLEAEIKAKAEKEQAAALQQTSQSQQPVAKDSSKVKTSTEPSILGVQATANIGGLGGSKTGGRFAGMLGVDLVLGRASAFHAGPRLIFMNPNILLTGGTLGVRLLQGDDDITHRPVNNPIYVDLEAGIVAEIPTSAIPKLINGVGALGAISLGQEYGREGLRPFWQIQGFVIINDVTAPKDSGQEYGGTVGAGVRF